MALTLLLVTVVLFGLFLGGGLVAQGYLYQEPADRLPVRALGAAVLVASFLTLWVAIDRRVPGKYDTLFAFAPYDTRTFDEFEAVRWVSDGSKLKADPSGNLVEVKAAFKRGQGAKGKTFFEEGTGAEFKPSTTSYMTGAIVFKPDPDAEPVRFNAVLKDGKSSVKTYAASPPRFQEEKGSRYVEGDFLGVVYVPSTKTVVLALLLNLLLFVVWFAAFWPILNFTGWHAFALTVVFGLVTMLLVMPLLFKPGRAKAAEPAKVAAKWLVEPRAASQG